MEWIQTLSIIEDKRISDEEKAKILEELEKKIYDLFNEYSEKLDDSAAFSLGLYSLSIELVLDSAPSTIEALDALNLTFKRTYEYWRMRNE